MAHGTTGTRDFGLPSYAARFAGAGLAVMAFDYRHFGASEGEPRQLIDVDRQLEDLRAAVSFARGLPDADADRVALWGTSLGAGHVVSVAAGDPTIAPAVAQLPFMGVDPRHKGPRPASVTLKLFALAARVRVPLLILAADADTAASMRLTEQAARDAPQAQLRRYPGSHFSAYSGEVFERMVADEVGFLTEHLRPRSAAES